jgi:hypothetical protein
MKLMIKFFRRIRQKLLVENRFNKPASPAGRYLLYAIGEIILVVIGILIALQINNTNEQKKERAFELKMLHEIRKEIIQDTIYFNMMKKRAETTFEGAEKMKYFFAKKEPVSDSVVKYSRKMFTSFQFSYHKGAYEALKSTGIDKVSNDSLRNAVTDLYDFTIPRGKSMILGNMNSTIPSYIYDIEPFVDMSVILNDKNQVETVINIHPDYFENKEFLTTILDRSASYDDSKWRLVYLVKSCEKVLQLIDKELGINGGLETDPKNTWN